MSVYLGPEFLILSVDGKWNMFSEVLGNWDIEEIKHIWQDYICCFSFDHLGYCS